MVYTKAEKKSDTVTDSKLRIIPGGGTPSSKRHMDATFLLSRLEREGNLLSQMVKTEKGYRKMYYPTPEDEQERKEFIVKVKSGEIKSYLIDK